MKKRSLHFYPVRGKALDIVDAILATEEVASAGTLLGDLRLVTEELVVNIADYAYADSNTTASAAEQGQAPAKDYLDVEIERDEEHITLCFRDGGVPFNPLEKEPPDITLPMELRCIGGLGIFLVIKKMDSVEYEHTNGENVLRVRKKIK